MKKINDVLSKMNELYFKALLTKEEYNCFESIRKKLIDEFFDDDLNNEDLCELLDLVDKIHIQFLTEQMPNNEDIINDFRQLTFKLIDQKNKIVKEDN